MKSDGRIAELELARTAVSRRQAIEIGEQRFLHVEPLGRVFLNMIGIGERGGKSLLDPKASEQSLRTGPAEQIIRGQVRRHGCDEFDSPIGRAGILIPKRNIMSGARKGYRPSPADKSAADDTSRAPWPFPQSVSTLPSTPIDCPEILIPASESRNAIMAATSCGLVMRLSDTRSR